MSTFEIVSAERFPCEMSGYFAPDDGHTRVLNRSVSDLYGVESNVIGLFLSEYAASQQLDFIDEYVENGSDYGIIFSGIVTFGRHRNRIRTTHFDIIAQELDLPLLRLALPKGLPEYDPKNEAPFIKNWLHGNSLVDLYFRQATITQDGTSATITRSR